MDGLPCTHYNYCLFHPDRLVLNMFYGTFPVIYTALIESIADYIYFLAKRDVSFKRVAQFIWCISKSPVKL